MHEAPKQQSSPERVLPFRRSQLITSTLEVSKYLLAAALLFPIVGSKVTTFAQGVQQVENIPLKVTAQRKILKDYFGQKNCRFSIVNTNKCPNGDLEIEFTDSKNNNFKITSRVSGAFVVYDGCTVLVFVNADSALFHVAYGSGEARELGGVLT